MRLIYGKFTGSVSKSARKAAMDTYGSVFIGRQAVCGQSKLLTRAV